MGFCLFNNVAIGAAHARAIHDLKRIAVVDFDVHHGNGTQEAFWDKSYLFFASSSSVTTLSEDWKQVREWRSR